MPRLIVMNDPHYSLHPPACRADTYPVQILKKMHEVARAAVKLKAKTVGCTGDWFHRKGKVTFRESNNLLAVLQGWRNNKGLDVIGILGNHDIAGHSLESLDGRAAGALVHSHALHLLDHNRFWIRDESGAMVVTGTSYFHGCDANDKNRLVMYGASRGEPEEGAVHVHLAHGTLLQKGQFFEDYTVARELIELLHKHGRLPDVIISGHLHFSEGIRTYKAPDGRKISVCRVGSLGRVASDDFDRQPAACLVATKGLGHLCREIPIGGEVDRDGEPEERGDPEEDEARIKEFVRVLREEADELSLVDHRDLLTRLATHMDTSNAALTMAIKAVERRQ